MTKHTGHLFVTPWLDDVDAADVNVFMLTASQDGTAAGMLHVLTRLDRGALQKILLLNEQVLGGAGHEFRPGWWPDFTPTASSGMTTSTSSNLTKKLVSGAGYFEWLVPATVPASMDKAVLYVSDSGSGEKIDVIRYRSGSPTTIVDQFDPAGAVDSYPNLVTLLADVQPGDTVRVKSHSATEIRFFGLAFLDSDAVPDPAMHYVPVSVDLPTGAFHGTDDSVAEPAGSYSSTEIAVCLAPTGSTPAFIGGPTHNDGTVYCAEVSCTETWEDDGGSLALAPGYLMGDGPIVYTRDSSVRYTDGTTIVGSLNTTYTSRAYDFEVDGPLTTSVTADFSNCFPMMMHAGIGTVVADDADTVASGTAHTFDDAVRMLYTKTRNGYAYFQKLSLADTINQVDKNTGGKAYWYDSRSGSSNVASPVVFQRTWHGFVDVDTGKTKPTLAVVIGADGVTATITGTTKSPRMTGTTGVTIKRGGSALTIDSKVNNGDDTITYVINSADIVYPGETITFDYAAGTIADAYGVTPATVTGGSVTNNSEADVPAISYPGSPFSVQVGDAVSEDVTDANAPHVEDPTYSIVAGSLPSGLSINASTGTISGTVG